MTSAEVGSFFFLPNFGVALGVPSGEDFSNRDFEDPRFFNFFNLKIRIFLPMIIEFRNN